MAYLVGFLSFLIFFGCLLIYLVEFRPPLRGKQLAVFWLAIASMVVVVDATVLALGYALGMFDCGDQYSVGDPAQCAPSVWLTERALPLGAIGLTAGAMWIRGLAPLLRSLHNTSHGG